MCTDGKLLRSWANECSARITVNVQKSVVHIQAPEAGIETIELRIGALLRQVIHEDVDLSVISNLGKFREEEIAPIAKMTNTFIEKVGEGTVRTRAHHPLVLIGVDGYEAPDFCAGPYIKGNPRCPPPSIYIT